MGDTKARLRRGHHVPCEVGLCPTCDFPIGKRSDAERCRDTAHCAVPIPPEARMRIALAAALMPAALMAAPIHYQPLRPQHSSQAPTNPAPAGAWLNYYGGKVIGTIHIVPVL